MAQFPKPVDYTALDYDTLFTRLKALFRSLYPNIDLEDAKLAEFTRFLLGSKAHVGDILAHLMNNHGRESRITTAQQRRSLLGLVKLIGYRPPGASAATVEQSFFLPGGAIANGILIPAGTVVKTDASTTTVKFRTLINWILPPGQTSTTITVENSEEETDPFQSTNRADQEFRLTRFPYVDESLLITTPAGEWTEVHNFLSSTSSDRHYVTIIDAQDRCTVRFGDGNTGALPDGIISCTYKFGGGAVGKLQAGALRILEGSFVDSLGNPVHLETVNADKTVGGEDRQSNALIRLLAPESVRVASASVAREDYEIVAKQVSGVARALLLTRRQDPSVLFNEGFLYIIPSDGGAPTDTLLSAIAARFGDEVYIAEQALPTAFPAGDKPKTVTFQLRVRAAVYRTVDITARIHRRAGYSKETVGANIRAALESFFAVTIPASKLLQLSPILAQGIGVTSADGDTLVPNPLINFGYYLKDVDGLSTSKLAFSDIYNAVRDAEGVREIDDGPIGVLIDGSSTGVTLALREFPKLGTVTLYDAKDGGTL